MLAEENEDGITKKTVIATMRRMRMEKYFEYAPFILRQLGREVDFPVVVDKDELRRKYVHHLTRFRLEYPGASIIPMGFVARKLLRLDATIAMKGWKRAKYEQYWTGSMGGPLSKL